MGMLQARLAATILASGFWLRPQIAADPCPFGQIAVCPAMDPRAASSPEPGAAKPWLARLNRLAPLAEAVVHGPAGIEFMVQAGRLFVLSVRPDRQLTDRAQLLCGLERLGRDPLGIPEFLEGLKALSLGGWEWLTRDAASLGPLLAQGRGLSPGLACGRLFGHPQELSASGYSGPWVGLVDHFEWDWVRSVGASGHGADLVALVSRGDASRGSHLNQYLRADRDLVALGGCPPPEAGWPLGDGVTVDGSTGRVHAGDSQLRRRGPGSHPELAALLSLLQSCIYHSVIPARSVPAVFRLWDQLQSRTYPTEANPFELLHCHAGTSRRKSGGPLHALNSSAMAEAAWLLRGLLLCLGRFAGRGRAHLSGHRDRRPAAERWDFRFACSGPSRSLVPPVSELGLVLVLDQDDTFGLTSWRFGDCLASTHQVRLPRAHPLRSYRLTVNGADCPPDQLASFVQWFRRHE